MVEVLVQGLCGGDQREVGERLGEVAELFARRVDFLGEEADVTRSDSPADIRNGR
ncbi:hypothetical protein EHYA_08475 [Embleya hyalina]|uniref:Uncharacterized protein n=1 Tax=Embleya hyalina TaxID=516124 RepID=A0A401Z1K3_9ACTN|nr:hypothetical protein [Embleya hyalina]GCE00749.1 hypothetical protein EHYA_08475 [Embleya hyalina]